MNRFLWALLLLAQTSFAQDFTESNLPILVIDTYGQEIPDEPKIDVYLGVIDNGPGNTNYLTDIPNDYNGFAGLEARGSTSQFLFPKIGYALETRHEDSSNNNVSLLGMPVENDWVLHGPFSDKTLIRNVLTYNLAGRIMDWAPRTRFCELVINGEYLGVYVLLEKVKRDNDRVDIAKLNPEDISGDQLTGGYILKIDKETGAGFDGWQSLFAPIPGQGQFIFFQYHYPKPEDIQQPQKQYIQGFMDAFEISLFSNNFADPEEGYRQYIDPLSFIDFLIINEITRNVDGYRLSTFLYKDRDSTNSLLKMGPVWDFNIALGNADYCGGGSTEGLAVDFNTVCPDDFWLVPFWWDRLFEDPAYNCELSSRWEELRENEFSTDNILGVVDSLVLVLGDAVDRNFERWPVLDEWVWPNNYVGGSYESEIDYLKDWLEERLENLDDEFEFMCTAVLPPIPNPPAVRVAPNLTGGEMVGFYFELTGPAKIELQIFDASGKRVFEEEQLFNQLGNWAIQWSPNVPAGVYFYRMVQNGSPFSTGKILRF